MRRILLTAIVAVIGALIASQSWADDAVIAKKIRDGLQTLQQEGKLKGFSINIKVEDGSVWMQGNVSSRQQRDLALRVARHTSGVKQVVNVVAIAGKGNARNKSGSRRAANPPADRKNAPQTAKVKRKQPTLQKRLAQAVKLIEPQRRRPSRRQEQAPAAQNPIAQNPVAKVRATAEAGTANRPTAAAPSVRPVRQAGGISKATPEGVPFATRPSSPFIAAATRHPTDSPRSQPVAAPQQQIIRAAGAVAAVPVAMAVAPIAAAAPRTAAPIPAYLPTRAGAAVAPVGHDHPYMPGYAWPAYASHPNYAAVTYPRQYSAAAWPYIGPFYPYPQVPLGWRKVALEWDDGWWFLDFTSK